MATDPDQWCKFTQSNNARLLAVVRATLHATGTQQDYMAKQIGVDAGDLSRWLTGKSHKRATQTTYFRVALWCSQQGWLQGGDAVLLRGFPVFLGTDRIYTEQEREAIQGKYVIYRFSYLAKGRILRGALDIAYDMAENIFTTYERHRIQAGKDGEEALEFNRTGAYFPRGKDSFLMISRKLDHHAELQIAYVNSHGNRHALIRGPFSDWHGTSFYSARLYGKRLKDALPDEQIETIKPTDLRKLDKDAFAYLTKPFPQKYNVILPDGE